MIIISIGSEYWLQNLLALRAGYCSGRDLGNGLSLGCGFKIKDIQVDYAFVNYDILNYTHRISVLVRFGKNDVAVDVSPCVKTKINSPVAVDVSPPVDKTIESIPKPKPTLKDINKIKKRKS